MLMVKSLSPSEENELQKKPNQILRNANQGDHAGGSSIEKQFSENSSKTVYSEHHLCR